MQNKIVKIFIGPGSNLNEDNQIIYEEGQNCDSIDDARSQYPIVKVFVGDKAIIYKGFPYQLTVNGVKRG